MKTFTTPVVFLFLLLTFSLRGQNLFVEPFTNGFGANGWTVESGWATGTSATLSSGDFVIPSHNTFACLNDDAAGPVVNSAGSIISPAIDLTNADAALLTFASYFQNGDFDGYNETAQVYISTDAMATWTLLYDLPGNFLVWETHKVFIGAPYAGEVVHIAFNYNDGGGWNFGFCVDDVLVKVAEPYDSEVQLVSSLEYTRLTANQLRPLELVHSIQNFGIQPLENLSIDLRVKLNNITVDEFTHVLNTVQTGSNAVLDTFVYTPSQLGAYTFQILASHPDLGANFYVKSYVNAFSLDSALMAKDDNGADTYIGMSYGDPNWYGYYGSEFDLINDDTLVGIDILMTTTTAGSFNLVVAVKDEEGLPNDELFHSENIPIGANFTGWVQFPLPAPMVLDSGNYVFAVGQDTIQGIMGHGMDTDRQNLGYWITSPVAGGGYPWTNYDSPNDGFNYTLMIRPRFKVQTTSSAEFVQNESANIQIYPNPATDKFTVRCDDCSCNWLTLYDLTGRLLQNIKMNGTTTEIQTAQLEAGTYLLRLTGKEGNRWKKVVIGQ